MKQTRFSPVSCLPSLVLALAATTATAGVKYWDNPAFKAYDVGDYVQDGLVLHYDGIRNAGANAEHSTTSDTWVNLASDNGGYNLSRFYWSKTGSGSNPWVRNDGTGSGAWNETNGFVFDGKGGFVSTKTLTIKPTYTLQLAMTATAAAQNVPENNGSTGYIFRPNPNSTWENCSVCLRNSANGSTTAANAIYTVERARFNDNSVRPQFSNASPRYATVLGTADALTCFEGTDIPSSGNGYKEGTISTDLTSAWFAIGAQQDGSPRANNGLQAFIGTLHAFRFYDNSLTEEQLAWNRVIDEYRFFGTSTPIPVTNVVTATSVAGADGDQPCGAYALDAEGFTFTAPAQRTVNGKRHVLSGYTLETWNSSAWGAPVAHNGEFSYTATATTALVRLTWQYAPASDEGQLKVYDVGDYVTGGLELFLDGICNAGANVPHNPNATTWVNLGFSGATGNGVLTKGANGDQGHWEDDGYSFAGLSRFVSSLTYTKTYTVQILTDMVQNNQYDPSATTIYLFSGSQARFALATYNQYVYLRTQNNNNDSNLRFSFDKAKPIGYITAMQENDEQWAAVFPGTEVPSPRTYDGDMDNLTLSSIAVGGWGGGTGQYMKGTIKSFRYYPDKILTQEELEQNRKVDEFRFYGRYAEPNVIVQSTYSYLEGYDKCGDYEVDGSYTFVAPETVTAPNGFTYACDGYTVEAQDGIGWTLVGSYESRSYRYDTSAGTVRLTWKWKPTSGLRTASDYSIDDLSPAGLRLHYDGKFNAGIDKHSDSATKWVNLGSDGADYDLTRETAGSAGLGEWTSDGYSFVGGSRFATANASAKHVHWNSDSTAQVLVDADAVDNINWDGHFIFAGAWNTFAMLAYGNPTNTAGEISSSRRDRIWFNTQAAPNLTDRPNVLNGSKYTYATAQLSSADKTAVVFLGTKAPTSGKVSEGYREFTDPINSYNSRLFIGGYNSGNDGSRNLIGTVKIFRYYDRVLTEEELIRNRNVDSVRYFGALGVTNLVVTVEEGENITASPAPGAYFVEGSWDCSLDVHGSAARYGYKLQDWDGEKWTNARFGEGTSYTHVVADPSVMTRIEWRVIKPFVLIVK